jgi:hypothetical protein
MLKGRQEERTNENQKIAHEHNENINKKIDIKKEPNRNSRAEKYNN